MNPELQSYIAAGLVLLTLAVFAVRAMRGRGKKSCGSDCSCGTTRRNPPGPQKPVR